MLDNQLAVIIALIWFYLIIDYPILIDLIDEFIIFDFLP